MFENFSFDSPVAVQRAESPAFSPTDCPPWHSAPVPSRPAHITSDARKLSLASTLTELTLDRRPASRLPSTRSTSSPSQPSKPLPARRAHSTTSTLRTRPSAADIRLQRTFLTQMQALVGSQLVDFSARSANSSDDESNKTRKFSASEAGWRRGVEKSYAGCGKRRKAFAVRAKWTLGDAVEGKAQ